MNIKVNKIGTVFVFASAIGVLFQTPGFDFYHHAIYPYLTDTLFDWYLIFDFKLERYLLLSAILRFFSILNLPLGIVIFSLIAFPSYCIGSKIRGVNSSFLKYFYTISVFMLSFLYSALSLFVLWLIAYNITGKKIFIAGGLFHPMGLILATPIYLWRAKTRIPFTIIVSFYLLFVYIVSNYFTSGTDLGIEPFVLLNSNNIQSFAISAFERKFKEVIAAIIFALLAIYQFKRSNRYAMKSKSYSSKPKKHKNDLRKNIGSRAMLLPASTVACYLIITSVITLTYARDSVSIPACLLTKRFNSDCTFIFSAAWIDPKPLKELNNQSALKLRLRATE